MRISFILILIMFISGCVNTSYIHETYKISDGKGILVDRIKVQQNQGFGKQEKIKYFINLPDGAQLSAAKVNNITDPNTIKVLGDFVEDSISKALILRGL
jgi:PBP1b-binding outer membrane lipoprotein LpoB